MMETLPLNLIKDKATAEVVAVIAVPPDVVFPQQIVSYKGDMYITEGGDKDDPNMYYAYQVPPIYEA